MHGQFPPNIKQASNSADSPVEFAGCLLLQPDSDTTSKGHQIPHRLSFTCQSQVHALVTCANCYKSGFPQLPPSLHLINLLEWLPELRETRVYLHLPVYYMPMHAGKGCGAPMSSPVSNLQSAPHVQPSRLSQPCPVRFLWRPHYTGRIK